MIAQCMNTMRNAFGKMVFLLQHPHPTPPPPPTRPSSILEQMLSPHIFSFYSKKCVIEKFIAACNFSKNTGLPEFFFTGF